MKENYADHYTKLHDAKDGKYFGGKVADPALVVTLVEQCRPRTLLDYGCGKGKQYTEKRTHDRWGGLMPTLYDIGVKEFRAKPEGKFDGVICCDMMEHIHPEDVDTVLADVISYAGRDDDGLAFVYLYISCVPSKGKRLADGRNVHLTVQPPEWWNDKLKAYARRNLIIVTGYDTDDDKPVANAAKSAEIKGL